MNLRLFAVASLAAASAFAAEPSKFCAAFTAAQKKVPENILGQGKCIALSSGGADCSVAGDLEKVRALYEQASRELLACIDVSQGIRYASRDTDEKGSVTLASTQLKSGEWGVEVTYWIDPPEFTFRVQPWRGGSKDAALACSHLKALMSSSSSLVLPGAQKCFWEPRYIGSKLDGRHDLISCELRLEGYATVAKALDTCLSGAKRSTQERIDARKKPAHRTVFDKWTTGEWIVNGVVSENPSSASLSFTPITE